MSKLPFVTLNHYTPSGFQTQDVVLKEYAEKMEAENKRLRAALREIIQLGNPWSNNIAYLALDADNTTEGAK
jgi:primosomal replication protein N